MEALGARGSDSWPAPLEGACEICNNAPLMDQQEFRRQMWRDLDTGWATTVELITAVGVWTGIGWLLDRWLNTWPWLLAAGAVLGFGLGTYLAYIRHDEASRKEEEKRRAL